MSDHLKKEQASLTAAELAHYAVHGFVVRQNVFDSQECEIFCAAAERVEATMLSLADGVEHSSRYADYRLDGNRFVDVQHVTVQFEHGANARLLRVVEPVNDVEPVFDQLIDDARLCGPMKQLVPSERLGLWTAKLNFKHPRVGSGFGWHQDAPYWIHDSDHVEKLPNVMVMFDDAARSNGCLRVIDGSTGQGVYRAVMTVVSWRVFIPIRMHLTRKLRCSSNALPVRWCSLIRILCMGRALIRVVRRGGRLSLPISPAASQH